MSAKSAASSVAPSRFHFAVITVTPQEAKSVRDILGLTHTYRHGGGIYNWGKIRTDDAEDVCVIHGSTGDSKGPQQARSLTRLLVELFDPEFILLLGTAGGIGSRGCALGQVVYSRLVRSCDSRGYIGGQIEFEEDANLPPDERLQAIGDHIVETGSLGRILSKKGVRLPEGYRRAAPPPQPQKVEIFSGPDRLDDKAADLYLAMQRTFTRVIAVEMEAPGVARELLSFVRTRGRPGYLVVKGVTDLVDDDVLPDQRKTRRKLWAPYASAASACFALALVRKWTRDMRTIATSGTSPLPSRYRTVLDALRYYLKNNQCEVYHHVHPNNYSQISQTYTSLDNVTHIFTVSAYEPKYFIERLRTNFNGDLGLLPKEQFLSRADGVFPHFAAFRSFHDVGGKVTRILLARDSREKWHQRNGGVLQLFSLLNGDVPAFVVETEELVRDDLRHLTDHVIFNSELWLDYYDESSTLIVTFDEDGPVHSEFTAIERHFEQKRNSGVYEPLAGMVALPTAPTAQAAASQDAG